MKAILSYHSSAGVAIGNFRQLWQRQEVPTEVAIMNAVRAECRNLRPGTFIRFA